MSGGGDLVCAEESVDVSDACVEFGGGVGDGDGDGWIVLGVGGWKVSRGGKVYMIDAWTAK